MFRKIKQLKSFYKEYQEVKKDFNNEREICKDSFVKLHNFCNITNPKDVWFYNFINKQFSTPKPNKELALFAVYGSSLKHRICKSTLKIFFTAENVSGYPPEFWNHFSSTMDLSLGFDYKGPENYLRFPLWITYFMPTWFNSEDIKHYVHHISHFNYKAGPPRRFCALVSSHDHTNTRAPIYNALSKIDKVDSGGNFLNNTDFLKVDCQENKTLFLEYYRFNICPENSNRDGYVTEKIFQAIYSGCIPIYWGSNNNPEPDVLNKDAILFFEDVNDLKSLTRQVEDLNNNPKLYQEFISQNRFVSTATEYITDRIYTLTVELEKLFKEKKFY